MRMRLPARRVYGPLLLLAVSAFNVFLGLTFKPKTGLPWNLILAGIWFAGFVAEAVMFWIVYPRQIRALERGRFVRYRSLLSSRRSQ